MAHGFLLMILLFTSIISPNIHACNQNDHSSLLSFNLTLYSPPLNWNSVNCCSWEGITCNPEGRVINLLLPSERLDGVIFTSSSSLANLTHLTHLNLSSNSLHGSLKNKLFESLNSLKILDLSYNLLSGELPLSLTSGNIRTLDLSSNHFHGPIPSSFFMHAWNLTSFNVNNNSFSRYIPSSICLHSNPLIKVLDFSSNQFSGNIYLGFGRCSELQIFHAGHNNLSGLLPEDIYNAIKLEEVAIPLNSLYGGISDKIVNLTNLAILDLSFNQLCAVLPLRLGKLSRLKIVMLNFNDLQGPLPQSLMNCTNLVELRLGQNNLEGNIAKLNFSKRVELTKLDLDMENVTGAMKMLMHCKSLRALILSYSFKGEGMPSDDDMVNFQKNFCRVPALVHEPVAAQADHYELELPLYTVAHSLPRRLSNFHPMIDLSINNITGNIPPEIGQLQLLQVLRLDENNFSGNIPDQMSNLKNLEYLDLSTNHLSGKIPSSLASLNFLKGIDISYNNLEGPIPTSTQLQSFEASAFEGNPKLCGAPLPNEFRMDAHGRNNRDDEDDGHRLPWFYISAVFGFIFGFWGVFGSLIVKKTWRYAYFQFTNNVQDRLHVMLAVRMNRMKRWLS
ncbi:receptor-like protein 3 [Pyrus communis]|uniref:receptor-like protein 3 n=1 Tax=Pyrus communis TaxID=23211 RepID=UPI0035BED7AB